jgi:branched-chain amino acid transport system permease protein
VTQFLDLLAGGVLSGALVALLALGISLIYRTTGILNLSQGAMAALAAFVCYSASKHMPMVVAVLLSVVVAAMVGAAVGYGLRNAAGRDFAVVALVATLALGIIIGKVIEQVWGSTPVFFPNEIGHAPVRLGAITVNRVQLYGFGAAAMLALGLTLFLRATSLGLTIRAVADSADGARLCGVRTNRVKLYVWAMASGLAAIAGFFIASFLIFLTPDTFDVFLVASLLAAVIGGLGSLPGTIAGAVIVWTGQSLFQAYAPSITVGFQVFQIGTLSNTFLFAVLIAVLLVAPRGLFGGRRAGRV